MPDIRDWAEHASTLEWWLAVLASMAVIFAIGRTLKIASAFWRKQPRGRG